MRAAVSALSTRCSKPTESQQRRLAVVRERFQSSRPREETTGGRQLGVTPLASEGCVSDPSFLSETRGLPLADSQALGFSQPIQSPNNFDSPGGDWEGASLTRWIYVQRLDALVLLC